MLIFYQKSQAAYSCKKCFKWLYIRHLHIYRKVYYIVATTNHIKIYINEIKIFALR